MQPSIRRSAVPVRRSRPAAVSSTQSRSWTKALWSAAACVTRSRRSPSPITTRCEARRRRSFTDSTSAHARASRAPPAAARATTPCVDVSSSTEAQGSAGQSGRPGLQRATYMARRSATPRLLGEDGRVGLLVVVGLLLARHGGHLDHDRHVLARGRLLVHGDLDRLRLSRGDRIERPGELDRIAAPPDGDPDLEVGLRVLALIHHLDIEGKVSGQLDARRAARAQCLPAQAHGAEAGTVQSRRGWPAAATGPDAADALPHEARLQPLDVREKLTARDPHLAPEVAVVEHSLHVRDEPLRVDHVARQEALHVGCDLVGALAPPPVSESLRHAIGDLREAVAPELKRLEQVTLWRVDLPGVVGVTGPVHEHGRLHPVLVQLVLDVPRLLPAPPRPGEQLEQCSTLLVRLLHQRSDVPHVVLYGLVLAGVEAPPHAEHEQDQHQQADPRRDSAAHHERLAVYRRASRSRPSGPANWLVRFVEEGQHRAPSGLTRSGQYDQRAGCVQFARTRGPQIPVRSPGAVSERARSGRDRSGEPEREAEVRRPEVSPARTKRLPAGGEPVLGRYRLEQRLGSGGFGVVWSAWDEKLEREVAVKVIHRDGGDDRIVREARAAARLSHPGIVGLYELAAGETELYLVSELVRGQTLAELERAAALSDRDVARIGSALCEALEHAHARGVVHRDVKPQNVMVVSEPAAGAGFAKLTDFGVAQVANADRVTRTGAVVGTLEYMAPEQAKGAEATPASDVYSLALTLFEAWTGSNPARGRGPAATARRLGRALPALGARRRDLPPELCDAIDDALEPDPAFRPSSRELAEELRAAEPELSSEGGLVEPETLDGLGLASARRLVLPKGGEGLARLGAGAGAGLLALAALLGLGPQPPFSPAAAAGAAALSTALLPRAGWLLAAVGVCGWLASPEAGREGTALLLGVALAPVPLMLPRSGLLWSLPALAPLLGAAALAPAFVGVAALVRGTWRRAALAAAGFLWLAAAEVLTGEPL